MIEKLESQWKKGSSLYKLWSSHYTICDKCGEKTFFGETWVDWDWDEFYCKRCKKEIEENES